MKVMESNFIVFKTEQIEEMIGVLNSATTELRKILCTQRIEGVLPADYIFDGICSYFDISNDELKIKRRKRKFIYRRKIACYLLYYHTTLTYQEIANRLGYKNHDTVLYHVKDVDLMLSKEFYGCDDFIVLYNRVIKFLKLNDHENQKTNEKPACRA